MTAMATPGQPGTLDPTWAPESAFGAGRVITPVGPFDDIATGAVIDGDGKVLIVGRCQTDEGEGFCVVRYRSDGSLDPAWNGGTVITSPGTAESQGKAIAVQPDGKVLVTGSCIVGGIPRTCTVRYDGNGVLDPTWNGTGIVVTTITAFYNTPNAIAMQPDGKVLVAGMCFNGVDIDFCTVRFTSSGAPDTSWNGNGVLMTPVAAGSNDVARVLAVQADGKVVVGGSCSTGSNDDFCAVRYLADGSLDSSWNGTGKVITPIGGGNDQVSAMALQPDGRLLLAGTCANGGSDDFCALRYLANGTLDTSWNGTGTLMTAIGSAIDSAAAMALQPDGKVLLAGYCQFSNNDFCVLRYFPNGTLDTSWNGSGKVGVAVGPGSDIGVGIALQTDGKVVVAGNCRVTGPLSWNFCAVRLDGGPFPAACSLDIDGDGQVLATTDALMHARIALGLSGDAVLSGITIPANAKRKSWPLIRAHLNSWCGMSLP